MVSSGHGILMQLLSGAAAAWSPGVLPWGSVFRFLAPCASQPIQHRRREGPPGLLGGSSCQAHPLPACPQLPPSSPACRAGEKRTPCGSGLFEATDSPALEHLPPPSPDKRRCTIAGGQEPSAPLGGGAPAALASGFAGAEGRHGGEGTQFIGVLELAHAVEGCAVPEPGVVRVFKEKGAQLVVALPSRGTLMGLPT